MRCDIVIREMGGRMMGLSCDTHQEMLAFWYLSEDQPMLTLLQLVRNHMSGIDGCLECGGIAFQSDGKVEECLECGQVRKVE